MGKRRKREREKERGRESDGKEKRDREKDREMHEEVERYLDPEEGRLTEEPDRQNRHILPCTVTKPPLPA